MQSNGNSPQSFQDIAIFCEHQLVSTILQKPDLIAHANQLSPDYFLDDVCREIFSFMSQRQIEDMNQVIVGLKDTINFKDIIKIADLVTIPRKINIEHSMPTIIEAYKQRTIEEISKTKNFSKIAETIDSLKKISIKKEKKDFADLFIKKIDNIAEGKQHLNVVKSGFSKIDDLIDGFQKSQFIVIGGRPGSGKTTFGLDIAYNAALEGKKVIYFSIEMSGTELHERLVKHHLSLAKRIKRQKDINEDLYSKLKEASDYISTLPIEIIDDAKTTIEDIHSILSIHKENQTVDMVVIDHLHIVKTKIPYQSNYMKIGYISNNMKMIAKDIDIPLICLAQLNRNLESREIKAPNVSDLRDAGTIEEDADVISFVYRPEYHLKDRRPDDELSPEYVKWEDAMDKVRGKARIIFSKNRDGEIGQIELKFKANIPAFYD